MANKIKQQYKGTMECLALSAPCIPEMRTLLYHLLVAQDYELWVGDVQVDGQLGFDELSDVLKNYSRVEFRKDEKGAVIGACMRYGETDHFLLFEKNNDKPRFAIC